MADVHLDLPGPLVWPTWPTTGWMLRVRPWPPYALHGTCLFFIVTLHQPSHNLRRLRIRQIRQGGLGPTGRGLAWSWRCKHVADLAPGSSDLFGNPLGRWISLTYPCNLTNWKFDVASWHLFYAFLGGYCCPRSESFRFIEEALNAAESVRQLKLQAVQSDLNSCRSPL